VLGAAIVINRPNSKKPSYATAPSRLSSNYIL